uniref:Uncharacterized protein n=1 Tax=Panagrolaimus sp. ES5 TaxID=591445 RepID=A0AC34FJY0_9BILA
MKRFPPSSLFGEKTTPILQFLSTEKFFERQGNENRDSSQTFFKETTKLTTKIPTIEASTSKTLIESTTQIILQKILSSTISGGSGGDSFNNTTFYSITNNFTIDNSTEILLNNRSNPYFVNESGELY